MGKNFRNLRASYPRFLYENFDFETKGHKLRISLNFSIGSDGSEFRFNPRTTIFYPDGTLPDEYLNNFVFHLGLIESFSYWKAACSPNFMIKAGSLETNQVGWWRDLLMQGMGEFFYRNRIDFTERNLVTITSSGNRYEPRHEPVDGRKHLLLLSGGKDSAVSLSILKKANLLKNTCGLLVNPQKAALDIAANFALPTIIVQREIDPRLLELNDQGFLNGHTPFSAFLAILSFLVARSLKTGNVVVSNERSANEANVTYLRQPINHQYSKSFQFEKSFRKYAEKYLDYRINYYSLSRPLWEIQIAKEFSRNKALFSVFRSCNVGQKTNSWCGKCPKCLATYLILAPFLEQAELTKIFGGNLLNQPKQRPLLKALIGLDQSKPFECVATYEENLAALYLTYKKTVEQKAKLPVMINYFKNELLPTRKDWEKLSAGTLNGWSDRHFVPTELINEVKKIKEMKK